MASDMRRCAGLTLALLALLGLGCQPALRQSGESGASGVRGGKRADCLDPACHEAVARHAATHPPVAERRCNACHVELRREHPSGRPGDYAVPADGLRAVCLGCHAEKERSFEQARFRHDPVARGRCGSCHDPHGSRRPHLLTDAYAERYVGEFRLEDYDLCWRCHPRALVLDAATRTATAFRNGEANLHRLHVQGAKGRTCRACHETHASDRTGLTLTRWYKGTLRLPLTFMPAPAGGSCVSGCHKKLEYNREHPVRY